MPFLDEDTQAMDLGRRIDVPKGFAVTPGADDLSGAPPDAPMWNWAASFRRQNELSALASSESAFTDNVAEPGFNPWDKIKGTPDEPNFSRLVEARNERKFNAIKADIARENEDRKRLDAQPWWMSLITEGTAGVLSPTTLLPGGTFVKGAKGGYAIAKSAASVAAGAAAGTAVQEAALQSIEQTRTLGESATAIGASAFLGGLIGAGGSALLSKAEWSRSVDAMNRALGGEPVNVHPPTEPGDIPVMSSIGAAATEHANIQDLSIAGRAASAVARTTEQMNPALRLLQSPNATAREVGTQLFENPLYLKMNMDGLTQGPAVETLMKEWNGGLATALRSIDDSYLNARKAGYDGTALQFREEVGRAMRRNDTSTNPEVQKAANISRSSVLDPMKDAAIKAELLPKDVSVDTAPSYFSRMWNRNRLVRQEGAFKDIVRKYVTDETPKWKAIFDRETIEGAGKKKGEELALYNAERRVERDARFGDAAALKSHADDVADEVFDSLTGKKLDGDARPEFIKITSRGPLKERTFNIPDALVEDFLEHDVATVLRRYTRIMGADIELKNKFGDVNMEEQLRSVRDSYREMRKGVKDEKQLAKLAKSEQDDIGDLTGVRDLLRNTYDPSGAGSTWGAIVRGANAVNYIRSMGEVVTASLTDPVRPAMVHGLMQFLSDVPKFLTSIKAVRLSNKEAQLAGNISERVLQHRLGTLSEVLDPYSSRGPVEGFLSKMTDVASKWNGIRIWTDMMKSVASVMTQNRVLGNVARYADVAQKEKSYLAYLGVDEGMAGRIAKQFEEHGSTDNGVRVAGTENWTDEVARRTYRAALNKDVDSIIVQKGVADVPLFANTPTGRALLQFKSFALASHQRVLLRGLQEDQARFVGGTIAMTMMGMFITYMKAVSGNRPETQEKTLTNPGWWVAEGFDRAGILSVPMEMSNIFEKASGAAGAKFNPLKAPFTSFDPTDSISQKNQNRSVVGSLLGPSAGMLDDTIGAMGAGVSAIKGDELKPGQRRAVESIIPFNSYLGARQIGRYLINPPQH